MGNPISLKPFLHNPFNTAEKWLSFLEKKNIIPEIK